MGRFPSNFEASGDLKPRRHKRSSLALGVSVCALLILALLKIRAWLPDIRTGTAMPHDQSLTLRNATADDLDDIVRIVWAGFPDDPEIDYRFPKRKEFPEDYKYWTRKEYQRYIEQPEKFIVHVIEDTRPIALAVWDIAVLIPANGTDLGLGERRDADRGHCEAFQTAVQDCFDKYFSKYAEKQVNLWLLVTHPDARRRGAGTMLVNWGLTNKHKWPVTVIASPLGELLYTHLRFKKIAEIPIRAEGEEEGLIEAVMERHTAI